jgi:esterase/lipase superfamily enzyme
MNREYHRWFSPRLGRDMELLIFGHGGLPSLVFPTSMGTFHEYEDTGMVGAVADKLERGHLQLFCVSTVDGESWYSRNEQPIGTTGCSFGAYHALLMALRRPDIFTRCVTMGGAYDIKRFLHGYYDDDCYFLNPVDFLPNLSDTWLRDVYRRNKWVLATGDRDICLEDNRHMAALLSSKGVPVSLHVWNDSEHDWPAWRGMAGAYLP